MGGMAGGCKPEGCGVSGTGRPCPCDKCWAWSCCCCEKQNTDIEFVQGAGDCLTDHLHPPWLIRSINCIWSIQDINVHKHPGALKMSRCLDTTYLVELRLNWKNTATKLKNKKRKQTSVTIFWWFFFFFLTEVLCFSLSSRNAPCTHLIKTYVTVKAVI